jgi:hypothetical protein
MLIIKVTHKFLLFLSALINIMISNINFITSECIVNDTNRKRIDTVDLPYFKSDDDCILVDVYIEKKNNDDDHQIKLNQKFNNDDLQTFFKLRPLLAVDINNDDLKRDYNPYDNTNSNYYKDHDDHDDIRSDGDDDYMTLFINTPKLINIQTGNLRALKKDKL